MTAQTDGEVNGCTFQWKIENISHCWLTTGERITSPAFIADALAGTKWSLWLYPRGRVDENFVSVDLHREKDCNGPYEIVVNYRLAFLDIDGSFLKEAISNYRYKSDGHDCSRISEERRNVFVTNKEAFLPDDTLTVQCTIWKDGATHVKPIDLFAQTILKVKSKSFVWKINKFSTLQPGIRNRFADDLMVFELVLKEGLDFDINLVIHGNSFDESIKYFSFNSAVINSEGKNEYYVSHEYVADDLKKGILATLLSTRMLKENESKYLPNDILSLDCKYLYSTGTVSDQFSCYGIISSKLRKATLEERNEHCVEQPNTQVIPVLLNDLKSMYNDGIFSDIEIRTSTQTFPAHKNILSARSSVFKRMFSNDMKENNNGHVDITDLEADTVHRMLLYIYTDSLEDLQLENACKLYTAADEYDILSLRNGCSSFLKDNLCSNKACDVLALADRHQDDDLKKTVQDFILEHDKEVFGSQEWKNLMATNIQLAADVMYRKVFLG